MPRPSALSLTALKDALSTGPEPAARTNSVSMWGITWRILVSLLISLMELSGVVTQAVQSGQEPPPMWPLLLVADLSGGIISWVLLIYRRRWPFAVALTINALAAFSFASTGPAVWATISMATHRRVVQIVIVGVVGLVAGLLFQGIYPTSEAPWWLTLGLLVLFLLVMSGWGMFIGSRRDLLESLRMRAEAAEKEHELRIETARANERERIAREMHDVLAHRISLLSMHAGALAYRDDLSASQIKDSATLIQSTAHAALSDLREVLGVLRGTEPDRPQPRLHDIADLVVEATMGGSRIRLISDLPEDAEPVEQIGRTAYRIVQEGLTNARKHASQSHVEVHLAGGPGEGLQVRVFNPRPVRAHDAAPGAGLGLVGLRERTQLAGGTLEVCKDAGGFTLIGNLPWPSLSPTE